MKIYTKTGDKGETGLLTGDRVCKDHPHVEAFGCVDECNSHVGVVLSLIRNEGSLQPLATQLVTVQETLFEIGAALSLPLTLATEGQLAMVRSNYSPAIDSLEQWIDAMDEELSELKNFILPGGHPAASHLHVARSVSRRAERFVSKIYRDAGVSKSLFIYLNRLSDYFFTASRFVNHTMNFPEPIWKHD